MNLKANGFRMPTEAEWEYVATGRGENRSYPWGNEEPKPGVHGNFVGRAAVTEINSNLRSSLEQGVMVVGSYPVGASRDGVMDLAGTSASGAPIPIARIRRCHRPIRSNSARPIPV